MFSIDVRLHRGAPRKYRSHQAKLCWLPQPELST